MRLEGMTDEDRAHFSPTALVPYHEFEKKLLGKMGQLVVLQYATGNGTFIRFGRLESEELVWDQQALITLPVSEFVSGPKGGMASALRFDSSVYKANIFNQRVPGLDHFPTLLGNYILGEERVSPWVYPRPSSLELFVGEDEANAYFKKHEGMDLEPSEWMKNLLKNGPDERFLAAADPSPSAWDEACQVPDP